MYVLYLVSATMPIMRWRMTTNSCMAMGVCFEQMCLIGFLSLMAKVIDDGHTLTFLSKTTECFFAFVL